MLQLRPHTAKVHALAFRPDGRALAVAFGIRVAVLDWPGGEVTRWLSALDRHRPHSLAWAADGRRLFAAHPWGSVYAHDLLTGAFERHDYNPSATRYLDARPPALVTGGHGTGWAFDRTDAPCVGELLVRCPGVGRPLARTRAVPDRTDPKLRPLALGAWVMAGGLWLWWPGTVARLGALDDPPAPVGFWDRLTGRRPPDRPPLLVPTAEYRLPAVEVRAVAPLPDGGTVLLASRGTVVRWELAARQERGRWRFPGVRHVRAVAVSPDGLTAVAGDARGHLVAWDLL